MGTTVFETDEADEDPEARGGRLFAPLRRRGHNNEGRDNQSQVIIALAMTRDGVPGRSWVLPGPDQGRPARLAAPPLRVRRRCRDVSLSRGLGRYILAVPMRKGCAR